MLIFARWPAARLWTALAVAACAVTVFSNTVYVSGETPRFLLEKGDWADHPWWLAAFYFHVAGASLCLVSGMPLMFPRWTMQHPTLHRWLGYIYFNSVLWMAAPSGLLLSLTAKGGVWGTVGFAAAGGMWWLTTWQGYREIRLGWISAHVRSMVRSYCWAFSAPVFRAIQVLLYLAHVEDELNYVLSLWLSVAASVILAESFLYQRRRTDIPAVSPVAAGTSYAGVK